MKKVLRFDKLFEYQDFLLNIDNKNFSDIDVMSKLLDNYIIVEGLIKTYPIDKSMNILKRKFKEYDIESDDNDIYIYGKLDFNKIKNLSNVLGYYISLIVQDNKKITDKEINQNLDYLIVLEPKYDIKINPSGFLYHVTFKKYVKNILKIGLIPKSKNKLSIHPDRIHLFTNIEDAKLFSKYIHEDMGEETSILEIDSKKINNDFFSDINFRRSGIYTINNISPEHIINIIE